MMIMNKFWVFKKCECCYAISRRFKWSRESSKVFCKLFDVSVSEAKQYRFTNKIPPLSESHLYSLVDFCNRNELPHLQLLNYPQLFKQPILKLEQQYLQLKEGGLYTNLELLAHYRNCIRKKISLLKAYNCIPQESNVPENFVSYLKPKPTRKLDDDLTEENSIENVHHTILMRYLMWKLDTSQDAIQKFCRVNSLSKIKSFESLSENFAVAESLGFTPEKILKHGYVLTFSPRNSKTILEEMPILIGESMFKAALSYPKLLDVPFKNYIEIYNALRDAHISDETIQSNMRIFLLHPTTLKVRLEEIKSVPALKMFLNHPQILKVIINHNQARSRLSFLQQIRLKCAGVTVLGYGKNSFNAYIREGKDVNNLNDMVIFVNRLLKTDDKSVEKKLKLHPYFLHVPLMEIEKTVKYLRKLRFSNNDISRVVQIILYPRHKIQEAYPKIETIKQLSKRRMTAVQKLNVMLYLIERDYHFTGDGIWNDDFETDGDR